MTNIKNTAKRKDDSSLYSLIHEVNKWMKQENIEAIPQKEETIAQKRDAEWEKIAREEEAQWWQRRFQESIQSLLQQGTSIASSIVSRLRTIAEAAHFYAKAAMAVSLEQGIARIDADIAKECLFPNSNFQFKHATAGVKGMNLGGESEEESVGIFLSSDIPGARVTVNAEKRIISVEFLKALSPSPLVILIPANQETPVQIREAEKIEGKDKSQAVFSDVAPGQYLLSVE